MYRSHVMVCGGTGCTSSNSDKIAQAFEAEIQATGLQDEVKVIRTGCFGLCALGPIVVIYPEGSFYSMVKEENVKEIVDEHLLKGRPSRAFFTMRRLPKTTPSKAWMKRPFTKSSCALRCATAASSTRRISTSTSPSTAMRRWARC